MTPCAPLQMQHKMMSMLLTAGNSDSCPSQDKVNNRSLPEQPEAGLPGSQATDSHGKQEAPEAAAQDADSQAMGDSHPAAASASEDVMQTPKRGPQSNSAFSAFMTPMARAQGMHHQHTRLLVRLPWLGHNSGHAPETQQCLLHLWSCVLCC